LLRLLALSRWRSSGAHHSKKVRIDSAWKIANFLYIPGQFLVYARTKIASQKRRF
jgi:hypothetical protein